MFGDPVEFARAASRMRRPHRHETTPCTTGVRSASRPSGSTPSTTGMHQNHVQHNELPYHTRHHGQSAQRAFVLRRHNERRHDGVGTTRLQEARLAALKSKKECRSPCHGCRTGWHSAAASAPGKRSKTLRSRARSGQLQCRVRRLPLMPDYPAKTLRQRSSNWFSVGSPDSCGFLPVCRTA